MCPLSSLLAPGLPLPAYLHSQTSTPYSQQKYSPLLHPFCPFLLYLLADAEEMGPMNSFLRSWDKCGGYYSSNEAPCGCDCFEEQGNE